MNRDDLGPVELAIVARGLGTILFLIALGVVGAGVAYAIFGDTHLWVVPLFAAFVGAAGRMGWIAVRLLASRLWP